MVLINDPSSLPPKIAIVLLCHEAPRQVAKRLAAPFFQSGDVKVYIHYDAQRPLAKLEELKKALPPELQCQVLDDRVKCKWGEYSLVEATHRLMQAALADPGFDATHLVLMSASCVPIRPLSSLQAYLQSRPGIDFIQAQDISQKRWVKDGLEAERYQYYFPFNYITQKSLFERFTALQRDMKIRRKKPEDLTIHFGSQWFCLTRETASEVSEELKQPALKTFFKHSWIPDEFAIQSLVAKVRKPAQIAGFNLTYYEFDERGRPLILDNGHFPHLLRQPFFFARKLAAEAAQLHAEIDEFTSQPETDFSYFEHVGSATIDYQRHLILATTRKNLRSSLGSTKDMWRGPMDSNSRDYYVVHASSRRWLVQVMRAARLGSGSALPLFDLPFDEYRPEWAEQPGYFGFGAQDRYRRDHDPSAYLFEMVHCHAAQPAAFGLDLRRSGWIRDFVRWDSNATLVNCDPWTTREQRAATALDELTSARDAELVKATLHAMSTGGPLPDDHADQIRAADHTCQFITLRDLGADVGDATLLALRNAMQMLDPKDCYVPSDVAWRRFWRPE
jgi:Core-2/I-Branching enzyme